MADEYREEKENTKGKEEEEGKTGKGAFRFRHIFLLGLLLLFLLALFSHDKADLSVLEGGTSEPIRNWIGPLGAQIARAMLYLLGLASYPVSILLTISILRPFLPYPLKRPSGYTGALITVCLGITILMAMWPQEFCRSTDALGIGRAETPALALSGGVIGSQLAAPETEYINAGLIRNYIGTIGTAVVAMILILPGLFFLFMADWKDLLTELLRRQLENSRNFPQHAMEEGRNGKTESLRRRSAPGPLSGSNEEVAEEFIKIVKNYFDNEIKRPEILGRIGYNNIVPFNFIKDKEFSVKIARSKLRPVQKAILEKYRIDLEFEDELKFINYILGGADSSKGGRDILNAINDKLLDELAMFMFENKQDLSSFKGAKILVKTTKDGLDFSFEND